MSLLMALWLCCPIFGVVVRILSSSLAMWCSRRRQCPLYWLLLLASAPRRQSRRRCCCRIVAVTGSPLLVAASLILLLVGVFVVVRSLIISSVSFLSSLSGSCRWCRRCWVSYCPRRLVVVVIFGFSSLSVAAASQRCWRRRRCGIL